jgi:GT2 family glycosyltransferase
VNTDRIDASVIVSTHNRAHYLEDALGALAAQRCSAAFEVIVIDNASTDSTASVLESWCRKDRRFRTAYEPREGVSCGKNAGSRLARAPFLLFTDDDTLTHPDWIGAYLELFARHAGRRMIAGGVQLPVPHDLGPWPSWFSESAMPNIAMLDYREERRLMPLEYVWGANMAIPRGLLDECGGWNEAVGPKGGMRGTFEDTEFQDRARARDIEVWFCPDAIIRHRIPRAAVTPRRISASAFARGRNERWRQITAAIEPQEDVSAGRRLGSFGSLVGKLAAWGWWVLAFRLLRRRDVFERARRAADESGRALETLHVGKTSLPVYYTAGRIAFAVRRLVLRLCPDSI